MEYPERNTIHKEWNHTPIHIALVYPNAYRGGIGSLALQTLYSLFNQEPDILCERFFLEPHTTVESLQTLESGRSLHEFDVIATTLQLETDYFNYIKILANSVSLPLSTNSKKRPLLLVGGPCITANPFPLRDFFDLAVIGEIDPVMPSLLAFLRGSRPYQNRIHELDGIDGFLNPQNTEAKRVFCPILDAAHHPVHQIISERAQSLPRVAFGDAYLLGLSRGCPYRCHFCLLTRIQNPVRHRSLENIVALIQEANQDGKIHKIAFISSAIANYPRLTDLCWSLNHLGIQFSLASIRVDKISYDLLEALKAANQRTLTLAPETGSNKLRSLINKHITNEKINSLVSVLPNYGIDKLRLYYILGLPGETPTDITAIGDQVGHLQKITKKQLQFGITATPFIPKSHTPFQWAATLPISETRQKYRALQKILQPLIHNKISGFDPRWAQIQGILSIAGASYSSTIYQTGIEGGSLSAWRRASKKNGQTIDWVTLPRNPEAPLPWGDLNLGNDLNTLKKAYTSVLSTIAPA